MALSENRRARARGSPDHKSVGGSRFLLLLARHAPAQGRPAEEFVKNSCRSVRSFRRWADRSRAGGEPILAGGMLDTPPKASYDLGLPLPGLVRQISLRN